MPLNNISRRQWGIQKGFTLLEVLITVVVVSVSLLGLAALQVLATRSNFEAVQRTQATNLANDVIDRMRLNSARLDDYAANEIHSTFMTSAPAACTRGEDPSTCLPKRVARDQWDWVQMLNSSDSLVVPRICITHPAPGGATGDVSVVVAWRGITKNATLESNPAAALNACGQAQIGTEYLKQVVMVTRIE